MRIYALGRLALHAFTIIFAICELGISANLVSLADKFGYSLTWANLTLAVSVITLVILPALMVLDRLRANALPSWTAVELGWKGVLWVLWLAAAAYSTDVLQGLDCSSNSLEVFYLGYYLNSRSQGQSICQQSQAAQALAWLNWIFLFVLFVWLLVLGIVHHSASNGTIWTSSVADYQGATATAGKVGPAGGEVPMAQYGQPAAAQPAPMAQPMGAPAGAGTGNFQPGVAQV